MADKKKLTDKLKISKAQKYMLGAVAGASLVLGVCLVLSVYFLKLIKFDGKVIGAKDDAIKGYSDTIKDIGVCRRPRKKLYSDEEIKNCVPDSLNVDDVPNTLRANVLSDMASNENLETVGRSGIGVCVDSVTGEALSYEALLKRYENSTSSNQERNFQIFTMCSALRTIPDALPAAKNELALMASVDKIFKISGWEPDSIMPGGDAESLLPGLGAIGLNLTLETNLQTTMRVLQNIERSIREINIERATVEWSGGELDVHASATAYYTDIAGLEEGLVTVSGNGSVRKSAGEGSTE